MVWRTYITDLAEDAICGWNEVRRLEADRCGDQNIFPVILGHSSGGGLAQYLLSENHLKASGLVLCAAVPGNGR